MFLVIITFQESTGSCQTELKFIKCFGVCFPSFTAYIAKQFLGKPTHILPPVSSPKQLIDVFRC